MDAEMLCVEYVDVTKVNEGSSVGEEWETVSAWLLSGRVRSNRVRKENTRKEMDENLCKRVNRTTCEGRRGRRKGRAGKANAWNGIG